MTKNAGVPEYKAREKLQETLSEWFIIRHEVLGTGPLEKKPRIDYWMYPRPETIERGVTASPIGVEAKGYQLEDHKKRTAIRVVYQAMMYSLSSFPAFGKPTRPQFVLIYPRLETILSIDKAGEDDQKMLRGVVYALLRIGAQAGVGELDVRPGFCRFWFNDAPAWDNLSGPHGAGKLASWEKRGRYSR